MPARGGLRERQALQDGQERRGERGHAGGVEAVERLGEAELAPWLGIGGFGKGARSGLDKELANVVDRVLMRAQTKRKDEKEISAHVSVEDGLEVRRLHANARAR